MLKARTVQLASLLGLLGLSLGLAACGGGSAPAPRAGLETPGGSLEQSLARAGLPSPDQAAHFASATAQQRMRGGGENIPQLKANAGQAGQYEMQFEPEYDGVVNFNPAWAMYSFYLPDYAEGDSITVWFTDDDPLPAGGQVWLGLADFGKNAWSWREVPTAAAQSALVEVPGVPVGGYIRAQDGLLLACVLTLSPAKLKVLQIGGPLGPVAVPRIGDSLTESGTVSTLDGSQSYTELGGSITLYEWDIDGDGVFEEQGEIIDSVSFSPGYHEVKLRVTDEHSVADTASAWVLSLDSDNPPDYTEIENNDTRETAQQLPAVDFQDFTGNCGTGGPQDGDTEDWYKFEWYQDSMSHFWLQTGNEEDLDLALYNEFGQLIGATSGFQNFEILDLPLMAGRYYLQINAFNGQGNSTDYILTTITSFKNEAPSAYLHANPAELVQGQQITLLGNQSFDFDGDIVEYAWDLYGDGAYERSGADASTQYTVLRQGTFNATLRVKDNGGLYATYSVPITVSGDQAYDEMEDNDSFAGPMALDWFPESGTPTFKGDVGLGGGWDGDSVDLFSFQLSQPGNVQWILNTLDPEHADLKITLYHVTGDVVNVVAADDSGNDVLALSEHLASLDGTYFLQVEPQQGSSRYDFSLHFTP